MSFQLLVGAEDCPTEQYTTGGECCRACGPGEGVVQECGANQTVCEPCLDSEYLQSNCLLISRFTDAIAAFWDWYINDT